MAYSVTFYVYDFNPDLNPQASIQTSVCANVYMAKEEN